MAGIVQRANSVFGAEGPPRVRISRQDRLFQVNGDHPWENLDRLFYDYLDNISNLLVEYLRRSGHDV
jgi:hypothetical protein